MRIEFIHVRLGKWEFADRHSEVHVTVETQDGMEHHLREVLRDSDLTSKFDVMWELAGRKMKERLKEYAANWEQPKPEVVE